MLSDINSAPPGRLEPAPGAVQRAKALRFDRFELRPGERLLLDDGAPCALGARAFDVLLLLIERRASVVPRTELLDMVWAGLVVEENNLTVQVSALRKLLGPRAITTVTQHGYQFTLPVAESDVAPPSRAAAPPADAVFKDPLVLLMARSAQPDAPGRRPWFTEAARIAVPSFGGHVVQQAEGVAVAGFTAARAALACARHLQCSGDAPQDLSLALCGADELEGCTPIDDAGRVCSAFAALTAQAPSSDVAVSARVAGRLVPALDGDLAAAGDPLAAADGAAPSSGMQVYRIDATAAQPLFFAPGVAAALAGPPTIAVLPFRSYTAAADNIGIGDVIADQIVTLLAHSAELHVISRLSTAAFRERPCSLQEVAQHLHATYVVSGRYIETQDKLTVDVEMADASRQEVVWKHAATDSTTAILHSDSLLTLDLVSGITHAVFAAEIERAPTLAMPTLAAHSLLLTAIGLLYRLAPSDFLRAKQALEALRERLPRHPAPLAWLSRWHLFKVVQGWSASRDEDGRLADDYANRALDAAPDCALALTMLGNARTSFHKDPAGGERLYDQALAINPNESLAWLQKGNALSFRGQGQHAMEHIEKAISLSPLDPSRHFYQSLYASASLSAGEYECAVAAAQASLRMNREHVSTYRVLAIALSLLGRLDPARRAVAMVQRLEPGLTVKAFVARSPGAASGLAQRFGDALHAAGLPLGA